MVLKNEKPVQSTEQMQAKTEIKNEPKYINIAIEIKKEPKKRKSNDLKADSAIDQLKNKAVIKDETAASSVTSPKQEKWMPKNWEKTLENLRIMRLDRSAPVDTMGCHKCSDANADDKVNQ